MVVKLQEKLTEYPGILLGKHPNKDEFLASYGQTFAMLAAPPGSGKGVGIIIPNLLTYPDSVVVNDPKFENWNLTSGFRKKCGHECYRFSPELLDTHRWNPLLGLRTDPLYRLGDARTMAAVIYTPDNPKNAGFFKKAGDIFSALILFLMETPELPFTLPQMYEIVSLGEELSSWVDETIRARGKTAALSSECIRELSNITSEAKSKSGWPIVSSILKERLSVFGEKTTAYAVSGSDFDFRDLRRKKMSVYFSVTMNSLTKYGPLMNLFFSQAIRDNANELPEQGGNEPDGSLTLKYQTLFVLDEIAVMGVLDVMRTAPALMRGYNIRFLVVFQNKAQLRDANMYGREGADAIMEAFHIEIAFAPSDTSTAKEYSERLGNTTVIEFSFSDARGRERTKNSSRQPRALMLPQEIKDMPYDRELLFIQGSRQSKPIQVLARKIFWYEEPALKARAGLPKPVIPVASREELDGLTVPMRQMKQGDVFAAPHDEIYSHKQNHSL
jgi:type IV secretion system protein VirD4